VPALAPTDAADGATSEPATTPEFDATSEPTAPGDRLDLNAASYEYLREMGLSVTQTVMVLAHRERQGSFSSVDVLDEIPGFPRDFVDGLKSKLRV
jgi:DNA uptake protein ComE-like DNA-binding protein